MESSLVLSALQKGALRLQGQFMYGSNYTFFVDCQFQRETYHAVYKPQQGERPLWDFPVQSLAKREAAAYLVSEALGWELVPPTIFRQHNTPMGPGSLQLFIEHNPEYHYFNLQQEDKALLPVVMLFDLLINNADRKGGHLLYDPEGKLWLIDHGLSFHVEEKLRTVIWDFAGQPIPGNLLSDVGRLQECLQPGETLYETLSTCLGADEINAIWQRAEIIMDDGEFPHPPEDRRGYPWPLV